MRAGQLVVATPALRDPNFARTVVVLLQAGSDDGALGLVLNRPSGTELADVLPGWGGLAAAPALVFQGGPVQTSAAIGLARPRPDLAAPPWWAPLPVSPGPALGTVDLGALPDDVGPSVERVRVFAGYTGWGSGQLQEEIEQGAWWVLDALPADVFPDQPELLWRQVLRRQGAPLAFATTFPDDPALN